ncbi:MAG: hypothetical protein GY778_15350, partial [bacterium]|nr:hypothetical protein [bacterium]
RRRDLDQGEPLRALLAVIEGELAALEADIDGLYNNWFIETCDEWVVPYIADLLGVRGLSDQESIVFSQRARIANTLRYRRRKGTLGALQGLIRDVTGWSAHPVEFFELLGATQNIEHLRPGKGALADLGALTDPGLLGGPFDITAHTVEVGDIRYSDGRHNIDNLGVFLWRLKSYAVRDSPVAAVVDPSDGRYTFAPSGHDLRLFTRPVSGEEADRALALDNAAVEASQPGPIRARAFFDDLSEYRQAMGPASEPV